MIALWLVLASAGQNVDEPRFVLHSASNEMIVGTIDTMDAVGAVVMTGHNAVAGADVVSLRRLDRPTPAWPRTPHLLLNNTDRIVGSLGGIDGAFLLFRASGIDAERLRFPVTASDVLWFRSPKALPPPNNVERPDDRVSMRNGDLISGVVTGFDAAKGELQLDVGGVKRTADATRVASIAFSNKLSRVRKPNGPYAHLVLINGTRLTVLTPTIAKKELRGQTIHKDSFRVALAEVAALDVYQGRATYLSDLKPERYEYRSYQGENLPWSADRALDGSELRLQSPAGVSTFDKGLAVHGECSLTYALAGKYKRFEAMLGLDPNLGKRGSAIVRVFADGRDAKIHEGKPITLSVGVLPVRLDVANVKELKLIVEWGEGGYVGDCVNWGDARLIP